MTEIMHAAIERSERIKYNIMYLVTHNARLMCLVCLVASLSLSICHYHVYAASRHEPKHARSVHLPV